MKSTNAVDMRTQAVSPVSTDHPFLDLVREVDCLVATIRRSCFEVVSDRFPASKRSIHTHLRSGLKPASVDLPYVPHAPPKDTESARSGGHLVDMKSVERGEVVDIEVRMGTIRRKAGRD